MTEIWIRLLFLSIGLVVGWVSGTSWSAMKYAKIAAQEAQEVHECLERMEHDGVKIKRDEKGAWKYNLASVSNSTLAWFVVLILVIWSVVNTGRINDRLATSNTQYGLLITQVSTSQSCTESFLNGVVNTLNDRTSYTGEVNTADFRQNIAFAKAFDYALNVPQAKQDPAKSKKLFLDYFQKLSAYLDLLQKSEETRKANPFPDSKAYHECLRDTGKKGSPQ